MKEIDNKGWSPYLAGALAGLVMMLSVWIAGKGLPGRSYNLAICLRLAGCSQ